MHNEFVNQLLVIENIYIKKEPLTINDISLLRQIAIDSYNDYFQFLWFDMGEWYINKVYNRNKLKAELRDTNNEFFIAYNGEEPVGFMKIKLSQPLAGSVWKNAMELEKIYVRASVRGQGIGKKFMEWAIQKAVEWRKEILWLRAMDSSLDSIHFYQKNGFAICGKDRLDYEMMKPEYQGMVIMQKNIEPDPSTQQESIIPRI